MKDKRLFFLLFVLLFILLPFSKSYSQKSLDPDSLSAGKIYKIILFDDNEIIGKVINADSVYIKIFSDNEIHKFRKNDIFFISQSSLPSVYRFSIAVKGGYHIFIGRSFIKGQNAGENLFSSPFTTAVEGIIPINESKAIRFEIQYVFFKENKNEYYTYSNQSLFTFKTDFLVGNFRNDSKWIYYFSAGTGILFNHLKEENNLLYILGFGAAGGYKLTKHIGVFAEVQFNFVNKNLTMLFSESAYIPVRIGLSYNF
jgi:hypothetical protein